MTESRAKRWARRIRRVYAVVLLSLLAFAIYELQGSRRGLRVETTHHSTLAGRIAILSIAPDTKTTTPSVLLVHGEPGSKEVLLGLALALARSGVGAHLIDLPGSGQARGPSSPETHVQAVRAAYRVLSEDPQKGDGRVVLLGQGAGADAVIAVAAEVHPETVITLAPVLRSANIGATKLELILGERQPRRLRNDSVAAARASAGDDLSPPFTVPNSGTLTLPLSVEATREVVATVTAGLELPPAPTVRTYRNAWLAVYVTCGFLLFPPTIAVLSWLKGEAPDVFLTAPSRPALHLGIAALAAAAAPLVLNFGVPLSFLHLLGGDVVASMALACAALRALLLWTSRVNLHMPPLRPLASSVLLGLFPFGYLYFVVGGVLSQELIYLFLDGPRLMRAISIFVFVLPFFLLEEAAFSPLVRRFGAPVGFLLGTLSKLFFVWAIFAASSLVPGLAGPRLLLAISVPLLTGLLLLIQMFTTFVSKSTENATMAASFGALSLSWLVAAIFPLV